MGARKKPAPKYVSKPEVKSARRSSARTTTAPFKLEVEFSGLFLYVVDRNSGAIGLVMPDGRLAKNNTRNPVPAEHADGTDAKAHVGYLAYDLADTGADVPS